MRFVVAATLVVLVAALAAAQEDPYAVIEQDPQAWRVKVGYGDLGDFGGSFVAAVEFNAPQWTLTAGWGDVSERVSSARGTYD
ncbi:MAG: hypothetical protein H5T86_13885, partial [Armatimonadetes bacterium]|nr:hypothetical protein [Armatimonadota bacterium]